MSLYSSLVAGTSEENKQKKFGMRDKVSYAFGDFGCNMSFALMGTLELFWTQYMGIPLYIWGIMILLLKIWDAINDPIIGGLMDAIRPKLGRSKFKPWIFWGSIVLMFSGALCFIPIQTAPLWLKIVVCFIGYLIWDMSYTLVNVPYGSLNSVITANSTERAQLSTWRSIGSLFGNVLCMVVVPMLSYDKNNQLIGSVMIWLGLVLGVIGFISFMVLLKNTTERVQVDYEAQRHGQKFNYFKSIKGFFSNRAAIALTLATIAQLLTMAFLQSYGVKYIQQTFPGQAKMSGVIGLMGFLPSVFFIPFIKKIVAKFGKKNASAWPMLLGVIGGIFLIAIPIEKLNPTVGILLWIIPSLLAGLAVSVNMMVIWAMVADCIDYQELKTGVREEGVVYATYSLGRKLAQGVGASLVAFLLLLTGYNAESGAIQAAGVNTNIRILLGVAYLVGFALQFVLLLFTYNLDKKTVAEMEIKLNRNNNKEE